MRTGQVTPCRSAVRTSSEFANLDGSRYRCAWPRMSKGKFSGRGLYNAAALTTLQFPEVDPGLDAVWAAYRRSWRPVPPASRFAPLQAFAHTTAFLSPRRPAGRNGRPLMRQHGENDAESA